MSIFDECNKRADECKRTHHQRREAQARAHYARHPELGAGVDVEARCGRDWWLDADLWPDDRTTEEIIYLRMPDRKAYQTNDGMTGYSEIMGYAPVYQELVKRPVERDVVGRMRRACERADLLAGAVEDAPVVYETLWTELVREVQAEAA